MIAKMARATKAKRWSRLVVTLFLMAVAPLSARGGQMTVEELRTRLAKLPPEGYSRSKAILRSDLGTLLYRQSRMEEASQEFEGALREDTTRRLRRHIYLYLGKSYESSGRLDKAVPAYEQALAYDPKNWRRYRDLALLYEETVFYRKAAETYQQAARLAPKEPSIYFGLGRTWRKMGLLSDAVPMFLMALQIGQDTPSVLRELSFAYEGQGTFASAASACEQSLSGEPTPSDISRLVYLGFLSGDRAVAERGLNRLKEVGATRETVHFYENLVELLRQGPDGILLAPSQKGELAAVLTSLLADDKTP